MADNAIRITNIPPHDGEYELDLNEVLTTREWRWIKQIGGYTPRTLDQGLRDGDPDVFVCFAVIAMHRAGKIGREEVLDVAERLADMPFEDKYIALLGGEEDASPPELTPEPVPSSLSESSETLTSSGNDSRNDSDQSGDVLSLTGTSR